MCRVLDRGHPVIFCGESGSGKSTAVNAMVHGNFQMQPDRSLTIVLVSKTISEVDPLHAEQVVQDAMSQFFFGKHRRTIGIIAKYLTLRFANTSVHLGTIGCWIGILQRLGFRIGSRVGKRLGVKYLFEKRQDLV
jgi:septin family protein